MKISKSKRIMLFQVFAQWRVLGVDMRLPLGMLYLGDVLKKHGYRVSVFHIQEKEIQEILNSIDLDDVLFVGVCSVMTGFSLRAAITFSRKLKEKSPMIPIIWGGVQPTAIPGVCLQNDFVDAVGMGEGEELIVDIAGMLNGDIAANEVKGLAFRDADGQVVVNERRPPIRDLDNYRADFSLIDLNDYIFHQKITGLLMTSRGCPFDCAFCYNKDFNNARWRKHSISYVMDTIRYLKSQYDFRLISFSDDNFFVDKKRAFGILQQCRELGITTFNLDIKINGLTDDDIRQVGKNCVKSVFFGTESLNPRLIKLINKKQTREMVIDTISRFSKLAPDTQVHTEILMALPFESQEELRKDIKDGIRLYRYNKNFSLYFGVLFPLPKTVMMDHANANGFQPETLADYAAIDLNTAWSLAGQWTSFPLSEADKKKLQLTEKYSKLLFRKKYDPLLYDTFFKKLNYLKNELILRLAKFRVKHWFFFLHHLDFKLWSVQLRRFTPVKNLFRRIDLRNRTRQEVEKINRHDSQSRNVYLFGTGQLSQLVFEYLDRKKLIPVGYFDNNVQLKDSELNGLSITTPHYVEAAAVIIVSAWHDEIYKQLLELGYGDGDIYKVVVPDRGKYAPSVSSNISYRNFGYLPGGSFKNNLKRRLLGVPNFLKRLQARDIIRALELNADEKVLDFGCGLGYITVELAKISQKAVGIDINPNLNLIRIPWNLKDKLEYINIGGENLPFEDKHFDVVLACEVLPMIEDASIFLKEIRRVLKPGGRIIVVNGNGRPVIRDFYSANHKKLVRLKKEFPQRFPAVFEEYEQVLQGIFGTHVNRFLTEEEIKRMLQENGFNIREITYSPSLPGGTYFEWQQFESFVMGKDVISTPNFFLKYLLYSFLNKFTQEGYPGGFICRAVK